MAGNRKMPKLLVETGRVVSASKVVDSKFLNAVGVQVLRTLFGRTIYNMRRFPVPSELRQQARDLRQEGILVLRDFVRKDQFSALQEECFRLLDSDDAPRVVHDHGGATLEQINLLELDRREDYPEVFALFKHPKLQALISVAEKRNVDFFKAHITLERLTKQTTNDDREADLHVDTFFNTHKGWLYLDEVQLENSPLVYVPGSHQLRLGRLRRTYLESLGNNHRSRRIGVAELAEHGDSEEVYPCRPNTLVIANTCGYHRRHSGDPGKQRTALHFAFRFNPFFPPGLDVDKWLSRRNSLVRRLAG